MSTNKPIHKAELSTVSSKDSNSSVIKALDVVITNCSIEIHFNLTIYNYFVTVVEILLVIRNLFDSSPRYKAILFSSTVDLVSWSTVHSLHAEKEKC